MSTNLCVWFYNPTFEQHRYFNFNKFVAYMDAPFCHCEIQFPDSTAFTVYMGTDVVKKSRSFDTSKYTCVRVPCTVQQLHTARTFAESEAVMRKSFSLLMMTLTFSGISLSSKQGTFCSKLCADVLMAAELMPAQDTCHISPSALYRYLHEQEARKPQGASSAIHFNMPTRLQLGL